MQELCDLQVSVNGQHTFILNQRIISKFSGKLKKIIKQEKKKTQIKNYGIAIKDFPGGPDGFELISRFCYNNGRTQLTPSNISILHCSAIYLEMTEKYSTCNLLTQTETFLEGLFYWSWSDILISLKNCESVLSSADSSGLLEMLISSLLVKISRNSDMNLTASSSTTSSSPETTSGFKFSSSSKTTPESGSNPCSSSSKAWWFDDLTILPPKIIEKVVKTMGGFETVNNSLIITKFFLHYLKKSFQARGCIGSRTDYGSLAEIAAYGVVSMGKTAFSCRRLFWVLRMLSGLGLSRKSRAMLERMIGEMLDQATLDDLLVSGHDRGVYDVNLVLRLVRVFVSDVDKREVLGLQKMKRVGRLIDEYIGEISPDQNLKEAKFLAVAESLPDSARDCFDWVYRAVDFYLQSHPTLSFEEREVLCRCLNYEKLSLESCKDLAKNPRIPPRVAVKALLSLQSKREMNPPVIYSPSPSNNKVGLYDGSVSESFSGFLEDKEDMKLNLKRMQCRVVSLEKVCREMNGQMSKMVESKVLGTHAHNRALPRLC